MNNSLHRPGTNRTYESLYEKWIYPVAHRKLDNDWLEKQVSFWMDGRGLAPRTVKILIRLLCEDANKYGSNLDPKPITRLVMKRVQDKPIKALTKEQSKTLLDACLGYKHYLPVLLALHTGMRRGEVWGLKWDDVDFLNEKILIQRSYTGPTKNGKSRYVPMSSIVKSTLGIRYPFKNSQHIISDCFDPNPLLKAICKKSNIPIVTFHALRHTFATLALEAGRSPKKVQEVLGHSALSTTLNIYWSSTQEKMDLEFLK